MFSEFPRSPGFVGHVAQKAGWSLGNLFVVGEKNRPPNRGERSIECASVSEAAQPKKIRESLPHIRRVPPLFVYRSQTTG
jgi:hypothetical protein